MTDSQQPDVAKNIIIEIGEDGRFKAYALSVVEDLWHDFLFFEQQALNTSTDDRPLLHKRFLRAALLCLFAYLEGVTHQWCYELTIREGGSNTKARARAGAKIEARCKDLTHVAAGLTATTIEFEFTRANYLRNKIVHEVGGEHDVELFSELTLEALQTLKSDMVRWLEWVGPAIGQKPHPDTDRALDWLATLGDSVQDEHSSDGLA